MSILNFFSKNKKKSKPIKNAIELAKIISNNNETAVSDIALLVENYAAFYQKYQNWCDEMDFDGDPLLTFAYWLAGYDTNCKYGAYIDWKEATEDIIWNLAPAIVNLGYPLKLNEIEFSGEEFTDEALRIINEHFAKQGFTLVALDTQSDCYHLFVINANDFAKVIALGKEIGFEFFNKYK
jgi:hypothetical protein